MPSLSACLDHRQHGWWGGRGGSRSASAERAIEEEPPLRVVLRSWTACAEGREVGGAGCGCGAEGTHAHHCPMLGQVVSKSKSHRTTHFQKTFDSR